MIRLERSFTPLSFKQPKLEKKEEEETKIEEKEPEANTSEQTGTNSGDSNKVLTDFLNNNNMLPIYYKPINVETPVVIAPVEDNEKDFNPDEISKADFEKITDEPKALDPLTGSLISIDEWNKKYDNGNQMLQVKILTNVGNDMTRISYEYMTASEYIQKYGNSKNPPEASILGTSTPSTPKNSDKTFNPDEISKADFEKITDEPKALDPLTGSLISIDEWNKKYDNGNQMLEVRILKNVGNDMTRVSYEYMTASEYIQKYGNSKNPPEASILGTSTPSTPKNSDKTFNPDEISKADFEKITDEPKALDPLTGSLISIDEWNKKYDNGNQMLEVRILKNVGNDMTRVSYEYMTASEYIQKYGNYAHPPKASIWTN